MIKFSQDKVIVPILVATRVLSSSTDIQMSVYDDRVVNVSCDEFEILNINVP